MTLKYGCRIYLNLYFGKFKQYRILVSYLILFFPQCFNFYRFFVTFLIKKLDRFFVTSLTKKLDVMEKKFTNSNSAKINKKNKLKSIRKIYTGLNCCSKIFLILCDPVLLGTEIIIFIQKNTMGLIFKIKNSVWLQFVKKELNLLLKNLEFFTTEKVCSTLLSLLLITQNHKQIFNNRRVTFSFLNS